MAAYFSRTAQTDASQRLRRDPGGSRISVFVCNLKYGLWVATKFPTPAYNAVRRCQAGQINYLPPSLLFALHSVIEAESFGCSRRSRNLGSEPNV